MTEPTSPELPEPEPRSTVPERSRAAAELPGWERATFEKLMFATLEEQRTARRWRSFIRLAWLAFFVFLVWAVMHRGAPSTDKSTPHTAVVEIKGEISSESEASAENVVAAMQGAFEDEGAQ